MHESPIGAGDQSDAAATAPASSGLLTPAADDPAPAHRRRRRILRIAGASVAVLLIIGGVGGVFVYRQLNANLKSAPLYAGLSTPFVTQPPYVDPFGRRSLNILVIGSDSRASKENCELGHACGSNNVTHADVELIVHVAADRSNATAMSIPRDTMTGLPGCRDTRNKRTIGDRYGQINGSLEYGPGCTVAAVQKLTGLSIDHFVMADFSGVIDMSDAVGGASVCVSGDIYDPLSHLKLSKGRHTVEGEAALQFVRTRHALGNGSDLGRTQSQHLFLSAVIRKLKSSGTLLNPVKVYSVAQAASRALTVDTELASVGKLVGLARTLQDVPAERITFITMPNSPDPNDSNRVVVAPAAERLFSAMVKDRPLSTQDAQTPDPSAQPSVQPSAQPSVQPSVQPSGRPGSSTGGSAGTPAPTATSDRLSKRTQSALKEGNASSASDADACAQVSTLTIVYYRGQFMTPARAYDLSTDIPDSAP